MNVSTAAQTPGIPIAAELARLAAAAPSRPAVTCGPQTMTRGELNERANSLAWALTGLGAGPGQQVAIILPNGTDFVVALAATWKAGGTPVPLPANMPAVERSAILELAAPRAVIDTDTAMPAGTDGRRDGPPPAIPSPWKILASGGSTGRPKLIASADPGVRETATLFGHACQMQPGGTALVTALLSHNGPFMALAAGLALGTHVVLMERFDAAEALRLMTVHRADWTYLVPTMMHRIWRLPAPARAAADLSSLQTVLHTGAPIPRWLKHSWLGWLGPARIWELYAGTEAQAATLINGREWLEHPGSVGRVIRGRIQVRDAGGQVLGPGRIGEIWMHPGGQRPTYTYIGAVPRKEGDWESLGDHGYLDADGYLYLADRDTDMILVGGSNVYPAEIEGALEEHPAVQSAAVIGLPDSDLGEVPHAIIKPSGLPAADEELLAHLRERLTPYKVPRSFEHVDSPLRDDAGKIRRSALRAERLTAHGLT